MVGQHHQLNAHEFEQTLGDGEALSSLSEAHREALCAAVHGVSKIRHNSVTEQQQGTLNFFQSQVTNVCLSPLTVITKYYRLGDLSTTEMCF